MNSPFTGPVKLLVRDAEAEARTEQSDSIEAEHLLLALSARQGTPAQRVLDEAGLDHQAIRSALRAEFERSLAGAGVSLPAGQLPSSSPDPSRKPRVGTSARWALHRAVVAAKARDASRLDPLHVLIGVLSAEVGTVPRSLDGAGVGRSDLLTRAESAFTAG
jgi:D-alanyl-D-alanine carboxypeptidase